MIKFSACLLLSVCLLINACGPVGQVESEKRTAYTVGKVLDGDSLVVRKGNREMQIRLYGIDAPEHDQRYSRQARAEAELLLKNKTVFVEQHDRDRYGRVVAVIYVAGSDVSVNAQLVERGAAWVYRRYTRDKDLIQKEQTARLARRGLWSLPVNQRIPPWEWRQRKTN